MRSASAALSTGHRLDDFDAIAVADAHRVVFGAADDAVVARDRNARARRAERFKQVADRQPIGQFARFAVDRRLHIAVAFALRIADSTLGADAVARPSENASSWASAVPM